MIRADTTLVIGGEMAGKQAKRASLRMISCKDGRTLGEMSLDSVPVWDGMAVANGSLFLSLKNGTVQCCGDRYNRRP